MIVDTSQDDLAPPGGAGPRILLAEHHRELELACRDLLARTYQDDPLALITSFREFAQAIEEHLASEEEAILPSYALFAPEDAQAIRDAHAEIRRRLEAIGIEVELHTIRARTVHQLVEELETHAASEDAGMYAWAQANLALNARRQLFVRIGTSLHRLASRRARQAPQPRTP